MNGLGDRVAVRWSTWSGKASIGVLVVELVVAAIYLAVEARKLWFFGDDWEFLLKRRISHNSIHTLFYPHNEHWTTLPIVAYRILYSIFGVKHYLPFALTVIALHIALCAVLWLLFRRVGISPWINTAVVGVMAFLGGGAENTLWDFQITFVGSTFFGLLALLFIDRAGRFDRRDVLVWVVLIAGLMCSGMGLPMCLVAFLWACFRRGFRVAVQIVAAPAVAYLIWYAAIGHQGQTSGSTPHGLYLQIPTYFWNGLTNVFASVSGISGAGAALLLGSIVVLFRFGSDDKSWQLAVSCFAGAAAMFLVSGISRIRYGVDQALASRYVYIGAALLMPLLAWLFMQLRQIRPVSVASGVAFAVVIALIIGNGIYLTREFDKGRQLLLAGRPDRIIAAEQLANSGDRLLSEFPDPQYEPDITATNLRRPDVRAAFPKKTVTPQAMLDARSYLQVGVGTTRFPQVSAPDGLTWAGVDGAALAVGRCTVGTIDNPHGYVDITPGGAGGMVEVVTPATTLQTQLMVGSDVTAPATWSANPGAPTYVASVVPGATLRILLPASGPVTVCTD